MLSTLSRVKYYTLSSSFTHSVTLDMIKKGGFNPFKLGFLEAFFPHLICFLYALVTPFFSRSPFIDKEMKSYESPRQGQIGYVCGDSEKIQLHTIFLETP